MQVITIFFNKTLKPYREIHAEFEPNFLTE